jgi:hypothetical protein
MANLHEPAAVVVAIERAHDAVDTGSRVAEDMGRPPLGQPPENLIANVLLIVSFFCGLGSTAMQPANLATDAACVVAGHVHASHRRLSIVALRRAQDWVGLRVVPLRPTSGGFVRDGSMCPIRWGAPPPHRAH